MLLSALGIVLFALRLLGFVALSALLVTVIVSEKIHRHPIYMNFVCTYLLCTSLLIFLDVVGLAFTQAEDSRGVDLIFLALINSGRVVALTATLNFVVHLWYTMRVAFHSDHARTAKIRTLVLLVTPYMLGIVPFCLLTFKDDRQYKVLTMFIDFLELSLIILTSLWDGILLFTFFRYDHIYRQVNMHRILTVSLLMRVFAFCVFRLIFAVIIIADIAFSDENPNSNVSLILGDVTSFGESVYALLACSLVIQRDILQAWFPCFEFGGGKGSRNESNWALDRQGVIEQDIAVGNSGLDDR